MSHIITVMDKLPVKFKNLELLKQALSSVQHGTIGTAMRDYYGKEIKVDLSLKTPSVMRGIGFVKEGDQYAVKADFYGARECTQDLIGQVAMNYQKLAHIQTYAKYGYSAQATEDSKGIMVVARSY